MKTRELKELKLTKNIIIPFPNFQQNTIISPTQMNDNFEEIEYAYNNLIDNHNGALEKINKVLSDLTSSDNEAIVNEQERIEAEEIRVNNEEERIANEEERKTEEKKRIAMYNTHLNDEIRREQKHIQMVGEFDTKVGEVDKLISTKTEEYNSFVETKTEEYNTFVETKEVEIQNAINSIPPKSELIGEKGDKGDKGEKGDKGDRGEQGLQGIQGIQGLQGVKGDKGDKGEQGVQGLKGDKGDKGDRGEQGVKGDTPSITHLETSINNKIQEVETRFNTLTSSQQQDAEVIDARDGETSLKARLDRDIEKTNKELDKIKKLEESTVSTVTTESDFTTVEATSNGYFEDVKIEGKTLVNLFSKSNINPTDMVVNGCSFSRQLTSIKSYGYLEIPLDKLNLFKSNGKYKVIVNITKNTLVEEGGSQKAFELPSYNYGNTAIESSTNGNYSVSFNIGEVGTKECIITMKDFDNPSNPIDRSVLRFSSSFYATSGELEGQILILEYNDDLPQDVNFFEGLKSVGDGADEIVVSSGENVFNVEEALVGITGIGVNGEKLEYTSNINYYCITVPVEFNELYYRNSGSWVRFADKSDIIIFSDDVEGNYIQVPKNADKMIINIPKESIQTYRLSKLSDKKRLLFYNDETQTWEKPILREWDSIEKHANGKYYYHQRSGEVVLNGSENWEVAVGGEAEDIITYRFKPCASTSNGVIICDKFKNQIGYKDNIEGIYAHANGMLYLSIQKTKASNIEGLKVYLQANNITVVYQLAEEKVYECTNIDLITYEGETNYIVESGVISPKTTLKVHNNISNVVRTLQEKVSLLENKFIEGLKKVLAGDMYSLAELLYPEDFVSKEEFVDVPTLLI